MQKSIDKIKIAQYNTKSFAKNKAKKYIEK